MEDKKNLTVSGYTFQYEKDAELAREERKKIIYLKERVDVDLLENVVAVYQKALDSKIFVTPVGWNYMMGLRRDMIRLGMKADEIPAIPLYMAFSTDAKEEETVKPRIKPTEKKKEKEPYKTGFRNSVLINILLVILVIALFAIALTSDNPNIMNYRNTILNEYAEWEQDLSERERNVKLKEYELELLEEE